MSQYADMSFVCPAKQLQQMGGSSHKPRLGSQNLSMMRQ